MNTADRFQEYLNEVREEVCRRCAGRGGFDGTPCGLTLPLAQLVEAVESARAGRPPEMAAHFCPCPMDRLAELAAEASAALDRRERQIERLVAAWDD